MTTPLRQKMIEDMQLRGLADRTQKSYLFAVYQLARHYQKSPDQINEEELRQYFLFLKNDRHASRSTCTINLCGIKFFFQHTLGREWKFFEFVRPPKEKKLPVVLSRDEVRRVLGCVHLQHYRVCLTMIYSCGLRLREGTHLQVKGIDSERKLIHIHFGKGQRSLCAFARRISENVAKPLVDTPQPAVVVSHHAVSKPTPCKIQPADGRDWC